MTNREKQIRLFLRVADQRLQTAEFLAEYDFNLDAVYLAGYTVECSLKALVLRWTPRNRFSAMLEELTEVGAKGHNFEYLTSLLMKQRRGKAKTARPLLGTLAEHRAVVSSWSTSLRYQPGTLDSEVATRFIAAARTIRDVCGRS